MITPTEFNLIDKNINTFKPFYKLDDDGFLIDSMGVEITVNNPDPEPPNGYIYIPVGPPNFYKPRWDGGNWTEGATLEEIEEIKQTEDQQLTSVATKEDVADLKRTIEELKEIILNAE